MTGPGRTAARRSEGEPRCQAAMAHSEDAPAASIGLASNYHIPFASWAPRLFGVCSDSSDRLNDSTVRHRSLLANSAATGFINRIKPKSSPSAT